MDQDKEAMDRKSRRRRQRWGLPWFRRFDTCWYATIAGRRVKLAKGEEKREEAVAEWLRLKALDEADQTGTSSPVWVLIEKFLEHIEEHRRSSLGSYSWALGKFRKQFGELKCRDLNPGKIQEWLDSHSSLSASSVRLIAFILSSMFSYGAVHGFMTSNPAAKVIVSPIRSRGAEAVIDPQVFERLLAEARPHLRDALFFLRQTGTRPGNLCRITADTIDATGRTVTIGKHKTSRKTGKPLIVPLTQPALSLLQTLAQRHPTGPLFRNARGEPFTAQRIRDSFAWLRRKLGIKSGVILYGIRHTFATELFGKIEDCELVFALGHKDARMLYKHYGHLENRSASIAAVLDKNINGKTDSSAIPE